MYHHRQTVVSPTNIKVEGTAISSPNYPTETFYLTTPAPKYRTETVYIPQPLGEVPLLTALTPVSISNDRTKKALLGRNASTVPAPAVVYANPNRNSKSLSRNRAAAAILPTKCPCIAKVIAGMIIGLLLVAAIVIPIVLTSNGSTTTTTSTATTTWTTSTTSTSVTTSTSTTTTTTATTVTTETIATTSTTTSTSTTSSTTTSTSITTSTSATTTSTATSTSTSATTTTATTSSTSTSTASTSSTSTSSTSTSSTSTTSTTTTATLSVPLTVSGAQKNFDPATLPTGWVLCYNDTYDVVLNSTLLQSIFTECNRGKLLLGCGPVNSTVLTLAAMGLRADVLFDCGTITNCTHVANGVGWYYSSDYSWGFVQNTDSDYRSACDTDISTQGNIDPDYRLCWHTGPTYGGYRCGTNIGLNSDKTFMRVIYNVD